MLLRYISNLKGDLPTDLFYTYVKILENYIVALRPQDEEQEVMKEIAEETYKVHPSDQPGFVSILDGINMRLEKATQEAREAEMKAEQAAKQTAIDIAKRFKEAGISISVIASSTGLSEETIQKL